MILAVTITYGVLLVIFLIYSAFILRHVLKYSYLSPRFRVATAVFGLLAAVLLGFSVYLLTQLDAGPSTGPNVTDDNGINF